jgi:hypothetical protein
MQGDPVEDAVRRLIEAGLASARDVSGCTEEEIADIEAQARVRLPQVYRRFLVRMGRVAGTFLEGSDFLYPAVTTLRKDAERLLEESQAGWTLGLTDFVFVGHQGYEFLFFDCDKGEDPPVRRLMEGEEAEEVFPRFSDWLSACAKDEIAAFKEIHHR